MPVSRIYQPGSLQANTILWLNDNAAHHLARVLRVAVGESLIVFNGAGGEYQAVITQITKKGVEVRLGQFISRDVESPIRIELAQGIARGEKMDFIVQKAVELGVSRITPVITERGNVRLTGEREAKRHQHWQSVVVSACEQCGRNSIPEVLAPVSLQSWLSTAKADYRFVLSPHVNNKLPAQIPAGSSVILLIGPEGGLSDAEVTAAVAAGFQPLSLGPRVLRTETAALAALTALQCRYGDFV
jgi:16S rRNA (uracil1498-N3)-methyltransferase